jgi:hypothetical protein
MLAYCGVVWFAITYLGHHYVIDAVGGMVYAAAAYWLVTSGAFQPVVGWIEQRMVRRPRGSSSTA